MDIYDTAAPAPGVTRPYQDEETYLLPKIGLQYHLGIERDDRRNGAQGLQSRRRLR